MWIGIGCGLFLLLGIAASGVAYYAFAQAADELEEAAKAAGASTSTSTSTTTSDTSSGGGTCSKAAACCKAIVTKSGGDATASAGCDNLKNVPEAGCVQALDTYKKSASLLGVTCE
jgi:hypothetical protein